MSNNHLTTKRDPIGEVVALYSNRLVSIADTLKDDSLPLHTREKLKQQQAEALGAITALGKVRDLQFYNDNYDQLSAEERRKIINHSTKIY